MLYAEISTSLSSGIILANPCSNALSHVALEQPMKRRDFLKSVSAVAAGAALPAAPAIFSPAKADARSETLLIVSEGGPNNLDIHGVGTNVPGYEVSWNCYDRLITHEMKSGPGDVPY